jgi:hypothetical protein
LFRPRKKFGEPHDCDKKKNQQNSSLFHSASQASKSRAKMSKRPAEDHEVGGVSLKGGERPTKVELEDEVGEFEDEFEDEYESEDEILEAGVDGRPDAEREAEEKAGEQFLD